MRIAPDRFETTNPHKHRGAERSRGGEFLQDLLSSDTHIYELWRHPVLRGVA
jgi:hypothetical protein